MLGYPKHYRIWCDHHKAWEPHEIYISPTGNVIHNGRISNKDHTVEYYNGYKDKNNKPICEGDIVLTDEAGWIGQVVFDGDMFCVLKKNSGFSSMCNWSDFEVLGNIHENPEKLEGEVVYFGKERYERLRELNLEKDYSNPKTVADELNEGDIYSLAESKDYSRVTIKRTGAINYTIWLEDEGRTKAESFTASNYLKVETLAREFLKPLPFVFKRSLPHIPVDTKDIERKQ